MNNTQLLASSPSTGLGDLAVFKGFCQEELQAVVSDWRLELTPVAKVDDGCYQVVREPWSDEAQQVHSSAIARKKEKVQLNEKAVDVKVQPDGLAHLPCGHEDALVGIGGVVWIAPGRRIARVATVPDCEDQLALNELVGVALTHAMALVGGLPLHGIAAEIDGIGVLGLGDSMAGKSTLALAILHAGGRIVSDDFLLARSVAGRLVVSALRRDLYIREGSFELIPTGLRPLFSRDGADDGRLGLSRNLAPNAFLADVLPQMLWFLEGTQRPRDLRVVEMSQAEALGSLLRNGSPLFISKRYEAERASLLPQLIKVVQSVPCFRVRLGPNLLGSPVSVVRDLLELTIGT